MSSFGVPIRPYSFLSNINVDASTLLLQPNNNNNNLSIDHLTFDCIHQKNMKFITDSAISNKIICTQTYIIQNSLIRQRSMYIRCIIYSDTFTGFLRFHISVCCSFLSMQFFQRFLNFNFFFRNRYLSRICLLSNNKNKHMWVQCVPKH